MESIGGTATPNKNLPNAVVAAKRSTEYAGQHGSVSPGPSAQDKSPAPKVLRDLDKPQHGFPSRAPDEFLKKGDGRSIQGRNRLTDLLKQHPVNRDPPFQPGNGGVKLTWGSSPSAQPASIFRALYDNSTLDFTMVESGVGLKNRLLWGRPVKRGMMVWGDRPSEVELAKWLPIFLEGIREYEEPYRFIAIMGSHDLVVEAGDQLHEFAADLVPPFKKALDTRMPTVVAVAVEVMDMILKQDPKVAKTWIYYLPQWCQVFNLFSNRGFLVNKGYNQKEIIVIKDTIYNILATLEMNGGPDAQSIMRRYSRTDPVVTLDTMVFPQLDKMNNQNSECDQKAMAAPQLCQKGCGFFQNGGGLYCSKCAKEVAAGEAKLRATERATEASANSLAASLQAAQPASESAPAPLCFVSPPVALVESTSSPVSEEAPSPPPANPSRCFQCKKRTGLTGFKCKCGNNFCGGHRMAECHDCPFDYKSVQRAQLADANPVIKAAKSTVKDQRTKDRPTRTLMRLPASGTSDRLSCRYLSAEFGVGASPSGAS
eukprot:gene7378-502_t